MGNNLQSVEETLQDFHQRFWLWDELLGAIREALQAREDDRQRAYQERNMLVGFLSRLYPSHLTLHSAEDTEWDPEWRHIVCVHARKMGPYEEILQCTWHIHDSEVGLFSHLELRDGDWDGHDTPTKYDRLQNLP